MSFLIDMCAASLADKRTVQYDWGWACSGCLAIAEHETDIPHKHFCRLHAVRKTREQYDAIARRRALARILRARKVDFDRCETWLTSRDGWQREALGLVHAALCFDVIDGACYSAILAWVNRWGKTTTANMRQECAARGGA